jgi:CubicO group peptidase (beta-lactamase class C family)
MQSVTQGITSMLVGAAMHDGSNGGVESAVLDFMPRRAIDNLDTRKASLALEHLLSMSAGLAWEEWPHPHTDRWNPLNQMWRCPGAVQHAFNFPMAHEPGEVWGLQL